MAWRLQTKKGFTLAEALVAMGILSITGLALMNLSAYTSLTARRGAMQATVNVDRTIAERFLRIHLQNAMPSFNTLQGPEAIDDNGRNFFDLNGEYPVHLRPEAERTREIKLVPGGRTDILFIVNSTEFGPPGIVEPSRFYRVTNAGLQASGNLTYMGPMYEGYMNSIANRMWRPGNILFFFVVGNARAPGTPSDAFIRPMVFFTRTTAESPPLGMVVENFGGRITINHPFDGSPITTMDDFLRRLPAIGGSSPYVYVRSVDLVRYRLQPEPATPGSYRLTLAKWNGTDFGAIQTLATSVTQVTFSRPSVAETLIAFDIETESPQ